MATKKEREDKQREQEQFAAWGQAMREQGKLVVSVQDYRALERVRLNLYLAATGFAWPGQERGLQKQIADLHNTLYARIQNTVPMDGWKRWKPSDTKAENLSGNLILFPFEGEPGEQEEGSTR